MRLYVCVLCVWQCVRESLRVSVCFCLFVFRLCVCVCASCCVCFASFCVKLVYDCFCVCSRSSWEFWCVRVSV